MGLGAKSYMRKSFLIYEEMCKYFTICEEAVSHIWLCFAPDPSEFPYIYEENFIFFFISVALLTVYSQLNFSEVQSFL